MKACDFEVGDGVGAGGRGSETLVGHADSPAACIAAVRAAYPTANGATYRVPTPTGAGACTPTAADNCHQCYAEFGMEHADGSPGWTTCKLEASNLHTAGHMNTANQGAAAQPSCTNNGQSARACEPYDTVYGQQPTVRCSSTMYIQNCCCDASTGR